MVVVRKRKFDLSTPEGAAAYYAHLKETTQRRRRYQKACEMCGKAFTGLAQARFCSGACRQRAHYHRRKDAAPPAAAPRSGEADA